MDRHVQWTGVHTMVWLWFGLAFGATRTVAPSGGQYTSIQAAVTASVSGDVVSVSPGTYAEAVRFDGKDVDLVSTTGAAVTVIKPPSGQVAVTWTNGADGLLDGFTLRSTAMRALDSTASAPTVSRVLVDGGGAHGTIDGGCMRVTGGAPSLSAVTFRSCGGRRGGGLYALSGADVELVDVVFDHTTATWGGAMMLYQASATLDGVAVGDSYADLSGGAFHLGASTLTGTDVVVLDPRGDRTWGVGAFVGTGSHLVLVGGEISGASAAQAASGYDGGAIRAEDSSTVTLDGTLLVDDTARAGGAISLGGSAIATLTAVQIVGNDAIVSGGGIDVADSARLTCTGCTFADNVAPRGGAVRLSASARLTDIGSTWQTNAATIDGGALEIAGAALVSLTDSTFSSNTAGSLGGAVHAAATTAGVGVTRGWYEGNDAASGGAFAIGASTPLTLTGTTLRLNRARTGSGGAIAFTPTSSTADLLLVDVTLQANEAALHGGGIWASRGDLAVFRGVIAELQDAGGDGGGAAFDRMVGVDVLHGRWHGNAAGGLGGAWLETGTTGVTDVRNVVFTENVATHGGAVAVTSTHDAEYLNLTFLGNAADVAGGHVYVASGTVRLIDDIFAWALDGGGVWGDATAAASDTYYDLVWQNAGGDWVGAFADPTGTSGNLRADPALRAWSLDGVATNDDVRILATSPCRDAGSPGWRDPDGSRADIGAYGGPEALVVDRDGDGWYDHVDCDDADPGVNPGAIEVPYDDIDQDCDGVDLYDADGDGFDGWLAGGDDCDDDDDTVYPGAVDLPYDGIDSDCDGWSDFDEDRDGYDASIWGGTDCDDANPGRHPGATETWYDGVDQDCDGADDYDQDGDGWRPPTWGGVDCLDTEATVHPGAVEVPYDGLDQDCDGFDLVDLDRDGWIAVQAGGPDCDDRDALAYPGAADAWYDGRDRDCDGWSDFDADRDGFDVIGFGTGGTDCDDYDRDTHPGAVEVWYDGDDADCAGDDDFDQDADGVKVDKDCDDTDPDVFPGAPERVNGRDDDCDGWAESEDRDGDGLSDLVEWTIGTDHEDPDSDDDGLPDGAEVIDGEHATDADGDGRIDPLDPDDDGDGIPTAHEVVADAGRGPNPDVDGDGVPNHLDLDADDDGYADASEGERDEDLDGVADYVDYTGAWGGGGCGGGRASLWLAGLLLFRRRRVAAMLAVSAPAAAFDAHGLQVLGTTAAAEDPVRLMGTRAPLAGSFDGGVVLDEAHAPLVEFLPDGPTPVIRDLVSATAVLSGSPVDRLTIDAAMPVHPLILGTPKPVLAPGDLRLGARYAVLAGDRFGVTVGAFGWVPTGSSARHVGTGTVSGGAVVAAGQSLGPLTWTVNAGARIAPGKPDRNVHAGPGLLAGAGVSLHPTDWFGVGVEATVQGATGFSDLPVEVSAFARVRRGAQWYVVGAGAGLTDDVGASAFRIVVGAGFGRVVVPYVPPEPDPEPPVVEEAPEPDVLPVLDAGETVLAALEDDHIVIYESIFFLEGRDTLRLPESEPVLQAVVDVLQAHPEIAYLLVEGHTNHHGSAAFNYDLAERRAKSVIAWMVAHGVDGDRLIAKGFGFDRPLAAFDDPYGDRANRRVEFTVLRPDEVEGDMAAPDEADLPPR